MTSSQAFPGDFQVGDLVDNTYVVLDYLGCGSMGHVYHVRHALLGSDYALKTLSGDEVDELAWKRFQIEAQAIASLHHPNVVGIYNFGLHKGTLPYYAMDLLQGRDLAAKIRADGPLEADQAAKIFVEVCAGIDYLHRKGIIHRDIKPGNIFLLEKPGASGETIKVVDFGVVKLTQTKSQETQSLTGVGYAVGTPQYMSPEQCRAMPVDARSDVYSLGCTLFEALIGIAPFRGRNVTEIMLLHDSAIPPTLTKASAGKEFPPVLEKIVAVSLAKAPSDRYQTVEQLRDALSVLVKDEEPVVASPLMVRSEVAEAAPTLRVQHYRDVAPKRLPVIVAPAVAGLLVITGLAYFLLGRPVTKLTRLPSPSHVESIPGRTSARMTPATAVPGHVRTGLQSSKAEVHQFPVNQIISASLMIQRPFSAIKVEGGKSYRCFNFPDDVAIGLISSNSRGSPVRAVGKLRFPEEDLITFTPTDVVERYPKCLNRFRSGDIYCVKFEKDTDSNEMLEAVSNLPDIEMLDFEQCWDLTPACVASLNKFQQLTVFSCPYSVFDGSILPKAKCWDRLKILILADFEKITPMLKSIKDFKQLRRLAIKGTDLDADNFKDLASLSQLEYLNLDGTYVTKKNLEVLAALPKLSELNLQNTGIDASASDIIRRFKALKTLCIGSGKLHSGQLEKLKAALPGLTISENGSWSDLQPGRRFIYRRFWPGPAKSISADQESKGRMFDA